jgi:putative transposase
MSPEFPKLKGGCNMPRSARIVIENVPHHVTQRGNRSQKVFFNDHDKRLYLNLLKEQSDKGLIDVWAYCLMDNHIHAILVPHDKDLFSPAIKEIHRRYTFMINKRQGWSGYLWQGRFGSFPMDEIHTYKALRYVERNPIRAGLVSKAEDYPWSSARAHVFKTWDPVLKDNNISRDMDWNTFVNGEDDADFESQMRKHGNTGEYLK